MAKDWGTGRHTRAACGHCRSSRTFCAFMKVIAASSAAAVPVPPTLSGWLASAARWYAALTSRVDARGERPSAEYASLSVRPTSCQRVPETCPRVFYLYSMTESESEG